MKFIPVFLIACVIMFVPADMVLAQAQSNFVTCNGPDCTMCNLVQMANAVIRWLFAIFFLVFAVIMVSAGFGLVTSGGNQSALEAAKSKFKNGVIGLLIVMSAWLLVNQIMEGLLAGGEGEINGVIWTSIQCQVQTVPNEWAGDPQASGSTATPLPGPAPTGCSGGTCAAMGIPCANANSCSISPDLVDRFQAFHDAAGVSGARVTEAMPPTRTHQSACHTNGTCIDYSKAGGMTSSEVVSTINAAQANGLRPVYEVRTQAQKDSLVSAGAPSGSIVVLGNWISAPHFSIYGY